MYLKIPCYDQIFENTNFPKSLILIRFRLEQSLILRDFGLLDSFSVFFLNCQNRSSQYNLGLDFLETNPILAVGNEVAFPKETFV